MKELAYLKELSEVLLFLVLPVEDFQNSLLRTALKDIMASTVLLPAINNMADPDFINQNLAWFLPDSCISFRTILSVIKYVRACQRLE